MRVFIDSNVLISAAKTPNGRPYFAYLKAVTFPNVGIVCEQNIDEIRRIFNRKFPHQIPLLEHFFAKSLFNIFSASSLPMILRLSLSLLPYVPTGTLRHQFLN